MTTQTLRIKASIPLTIDVGDPVGPSGGGVLVRNVSVGGEPIADIYLTEDDEPFEMEVYGLGMLDVEALPEISAPLEMVAKLAATKYFEAVAAAGGA